MPKDNENDIGGRVGLDITDFKANVAELNRQIKVIDTGFKAAAAGMEDWGKSEEGLQTRIDALNKITDLQRQKVENLTEQYKKVAAEKGEDSKAAQDLLIRINRETEALNKNQKELRGATTALANLGNESSETAKDVDKLDKSLDETVMSLDEIGGNVAEAAKTGIAAIGAAALAAVGSLLKFGDDSARAMNTFQAQTGATAEEMEEFREVASELYADNFGESLDDVARSMAFVKQTTNQAGEELKNTTKQALLMRDTFGFEVSQSINAVNSLMQKFKISADQAYTLIAQGAQNGANKNGDLLDVMNEYAPQFAALGFSADQFTDILIQGAKDGAFQVDKVGDAIKEFTIRSKDMSKGTNEAFTTLGFDAKKMGDDFAAGGERAQNAFVEVITALNNLNDPIIRNQVGVQLFGTMFEDLEASSILALGNVQSYTNSTADTLQQINEVRYDDVGSALQGLGRQFVTSIAEPVGKEVLPKINELITTLKTADTSQIVDGFKWLLDNTNNIIAAAVAIGTGMAVWNVATMINNVVKAIKAQQLATEGVTLAQAALNLVLKDNPIGLVITLIAALVAAIIYLWKTNDGFRNAIIEAFADVKNALASVYDWLKSDWKNLLLLLTNPFLAAIKMLYGLNPRFRAWVDELLGDFKEIPDEMIDIGADLVKGLWNGIKNMTSWIKSKISGFANTVVSTAKSTLGIQSPSTVMRDQVGKMIGAGMAEGIANSASMVDAAMKSLNRQIVADGSVNISSGVPAKVGGGQIAPQVPGVSSSSVTYSGDVNITIPVRDLKEFKEVRDFFEGFRQKHRSYSPA